MFSCFEAVLMLPKVCFHGVGEDHFEAREVPFVAELGKWFVSSFNLV